MAAYQVTTVLGARLVSDLLRRFLVDIPDLLCVLDRGVQGDVGVTIVGRKLIARESAILLEDLGYDILWMAEHHFQREGYECIPNLLILSQYLAQHTKRI